MTSSEDQVVGAAGADLVLARPVDRTRLNLERVRAYRDFLAGPSFDRPTVFTDSDVFMLRDPEPIFAEAFDIGLTWRIGGGIWQQSAGGPKHVFRMPYNFGVVFAQPRPGALSFFERFMANCERLPASLQYWGCDQQALAQALPLSDDELRSRRDLDDAGTAIRLFPCETHNFTPPDAMTPLEAARLGKWFIHYKGARKIGL